MVFVRRLFIWSSVAKGHSVPAERGAREKRKSTEHYSEYSETSQGLSHADEMNGLFRLF